MSSFFPVYSRTSDALNQKRLSSTLQSNQAKLNQIQQQIATGHRIGAPSEDPIAALRAVRYQAALERNTQYARNLQTNQSFLDATDSQIRATSNLLSQIKGNLPGWADSTLTDAQRQAAIAELSAIRSQLLGIANTKYNGRYLFSGSDSAVLPYEINGQHVQYNGNDGQIQAPSEIDQLLQSNIPGTQVFGGISSEIRGLNQLVPYLTSTTKLSDLRGGEGISSGAIEVSDGYQSSIVDLSSADTVGDVVRLLEANPPGDRQLSVEIKSDRLELRFVDGLSEQLSIRESNGGTTAADLGIRSDLASLSGSTVVGQALSPKLSIQTRLSQVTGSPAIATLTSPGDGNDIVFQSKTNGTANNGLNIQYVNSEWLQAAAGIPQGSEKVFFESTPRAAVAGLSLTGGGNDILLTSPSGGSHLNQVSIQLYDAGAIGDAALASYDSSTQTYRIGIDTANNTTIQKVVDAINAEGTFVATPDNSDPANGSYNAFSTVETSDIGEVGNTGNSGGDANTVYIHVNPEKTEAKHVLAALNKNTALTSLYHIQLDVTDGINTTTPSKLIVDSNATAVTAGGAGEDFDGPPGIEIRLDDKRYRLNLQNVDTIEDLINEVETQVPGMYVQINAEGNGLNVGTTQSGVRFSVGENGGFSAGQLGLRSMRPETLLSTLNNGQGVSTQNGTDFIIHRNDGTSIDIDISSAHTLQDVLDIINQHPDNQDPNTLVQATLSQYSNAITLLDDNPTGSMPVWLEVVSGSNAAIDLGLVNPGEVAGYPTNTPVPTQAYADIYYSGATGVERSFKITANDPGDQYNNIEVEVVSGLTGDNATATFDSLNQKLIIQVDPGNTRTSTVVQAIKDTGYFRAELINNDYEAYNSGSGIVSTLGVIATLGGGSASPSATPATAILRPVAPNQYNTAIDIESNQPGTLHNFARFHFVPGASGDTASAFWDNTTRKLMVTIDPAATTSNTIIAAINAEGTFSASLNTEVDPTNDGTGVYVNTGVVGTAMFGTPGTFKGRDVSMKENQSIFNTLDRMIAALQDKTETGRTELARTSGLLDLDIERVNEAISSVGYRGQYNDFLIAQNEDLNLDLQENLSDELDVDLVDAISRLTAQQATVEASMRMLSQTFNVSLLDYL